MKNLKILLSLTVVLIATSLFAQKVEEKATQTDYPIMTFDKATHDFGTINEGDRVETVYTFTNTGKAPLVIAKIKASCGCTVPSGWKKTPILPGEKGQFTVKFNSRNKPNKQRKSITVTCNTEKGRERVSFTAQVIPDPEQVKIRAERVAKRKERAAQRKAEQEKKKAEAGMIKEERKGFPVSNDLKKKKN